MKALWLLVQYAPKRCASILVCSLLNGMSSAIVIAWVGRQFSRPTSLNSHFIGIFALLVGTAIVLDWATKWILTHFAGQVVYSLRVSLSRQILAKPLEALERLGSPRLFSLLTEDLLLFSAALGTLPVLCTSSATLLFCTLYLAWIAPVMILLMGLITMPAYIGYRSLQRRAHASTKATLNQRNRVFDLYRDLVEGVKELQLHSERRRSFLQEVLAPQMATLQKAGISSRLAHYAAQLWSQVASFCILFGVIGWCAFTKKNLHEITIYAFTLLYAKNALGALSRTLPDWADAKAAIQGMESAGFQFTFVAPNLPSAPPTQQTSVHIEMRGISYEYTHHDTEQNFWLGPLTMDFHSGEIVLISGANGSGKTTLMKLLTGLYLPAEGSLLLNGVPITEENREAYRQNFSALLTDPYLFEQLLGIAPQRIDQHTQKYLELLQLDHKVKVTGNTLSTTNLSYGQRRRLALLTAYLEDRPVYLFDEWASGQDPEFKEVFYRQILPDLKRQGKLILVVSHDESYFDVVDRRFHLDFGQLVSPTEREILSSC